MFITEEALKNSSAKLVNKGDLLYALYGATSGEVDISQINGAINQAILCIRSDCIDVRFLAYLLFFKKENIINTYLQGGQGNLSTEIIKNIELFFPNTQNESKKLIKFFEIIDKRIEKQRQLVESLKKYKRGLLSAIFERKIRFSTNGWVNYKIGQLGCFYNGLSGKNKDDFGLGNNEFITYMNVYKNTVADIQMCEKVNIANNEKQNKVKFGDIMFTQSSETLEEVGFSSVWLEDKNPYLNSFCFGFRLFDSDNFLPLFLAYYLRSDFIRKLIMREGQGVTRVNLSSERLKNINLHLPDIQEQNKIANFIFKYDNKIKMVESILKKQELIKKSLLQQMFI